MNPFRLLLATIGVFCLATLVWLGAAMFLITATLDAAERQLFEAALQPRLALAVLAWLVGMGLAAATFRQLIDRYVSAPARLAEEARLLLHSTTQQRLEPRGSPELHEIATIINELAVQRDGSRSGVSQQIEAANHALRQEKNYLAVLMSELTQSVVVCNLDGCILLFNNRARQQFRARSTAPLLADGSELIGIGRSIYGVLDRPLVEHALRRIQQKISHGVMGAAAHFVTASASGELLRVNMAAVSDAGSPFEDGHVELNGFLVMFENVTELFQRDSKQADVCSQLISSSLASLVKTQAAFDALAQCGASPATQGDLTARLGDELSNLRRNFDSRALEASKDFSTRWPVEDIWGVDFVAAAQSQIERDCGCTVTADTVDGEIWLKVDSFSLLQVLGHLAGRVAAECKVRHFHLRLECNGQRAKLDLCWTGVEVDAEEAVSWQNGSIDFASRIACLSARDIVQRQGGDLWFESADELHAVHFALSLPLADAREHEQRLKKGDARPEYYDFDLFRFNGQSSTLDDRPLCELTYTVFDTETTGLNPSAGDEIIQIGAARIVNKKILKGEYFDHLVDPGRTIAPASIPIHGITDAMVAGKPAIAQVLPAFHAFALDSVLVAHNAAFDMKFLQLKERSSGIAFSHPVLDTLLLSAVVHPNQKSHTLDAIAARLNIVALDRHTALGDALVTAEIWLRLIPLLEKRGVRTLRQALEASEKTRYARLKY